MLSVAVVVIVFAFAGLFVFTADRASWAPEKDAEKVPVPAEGDSAESRLGNR